MALGSNTIFFLVGWTVRTGGVVVEKCLPTWAHVESGIAVGDCPYGRALLGDVSWIDSSSEDDPFPNILAVIYGYVPYVIAATFGLELVAKRGTRELQFAIFIVLIVVLNEVAWKRIIQQARPIGSCLTTCGMPSGHSTLAMGLYTLVFLDFSFRLRPTDQRRVRFFCDTGTAPRCLRFGRCVFSIALSSASVLSHHEFVMVTMIWFFILIPVPASRVYLRDHSILQISIGSIIGFLEAVCWFSCTRWLAWRYKGYLNTWKLPPHSRFHVIIHNHGYPDYELETCDDIGKVGVEMQPTHSWEKSKTTE